MNGFPYSVIASLHTLADLVNELYIGSVPTAFHVLHPDPRSGDIVYVVTVFPLLLLTLPVLGALHPICQHPLLTGVHVNVTLMSTFLVASALYRRIWYLV